MARTDPRVPPTADPSRLQDPTFPFPAKAFSGRMQDAPLIRAVQPAAPAGKGPQPVQATSLPPQARALLATIGGPGFESNGSYTQRFNQPDFSDFSKHPGTYGNITRGPSAGLKSNAAGRYQFLSTTFANQARKQGLTDFSPESQDKAAWGLAKDTYAAKYPGRDLTADIQNPGNLPRIAQALHGQWSSLPGGMEQGSNLAKFSSTFMSNLKTETARGPATPAAAPVGTGQLPAADQPRPMILAANPVASFIFGGGQGPSGGFA